MTQNNSVIIENHAFPLVSTSKYLFLKKHILFLSYDDYHKMSFYNRFVVCGSNGLIHLSVPLINGRDQKIPFKDVRICYGEKWQLRHWLTITSCYNRSPYFEYYRDELEKFFKNRWEFLFDWNFATLNWLRQVLKFPAELIITAQLVDGSIEDARNKWLPKNFQQVDLGFQYAQVFEEKIGFQNNLSILDLLFNLGPKARNLLIGSCL
jgi:WbqC-like protein family